MDIVDVYELDRLEFGAVGRQVSGIGPKESHYTDDGKLILRLLVIDDEHATSIGKLTEDTEYLDYVLDQNGIDPLNLNDVKPELYITNDFNLGQAALREDQDFGYQFDGALVDLLDQSQSNRDWQGLLALQEARNRVTTPPIGVMIVSRYIGETETTEKIASYRDLDYVFTADKTVWQNQGESQRDQLRGFYDYLVRRRQYLNKPVARAFEAFGGYQTFQDIHRKLAILEKDPNKDLPVLILGNSGTGKELVARLVHAMDQDGVAGDFQEKFKSILVASMGPGVLEGMLFGWRRGAFSGADSDFEGLIRQHEGGTLFFDEAGDIPLDIQGALLRFLQEREIQPAGTTETVRLEEPTRLVFATNRDVMQLMEDGDIRADFLHRIDGIVIRLPDLTERSEDYETLLDHLIKTYIDPETDTVEGALSADVRNHLQELMAKGGFTGNVRQLDRFINRLILIKPDGESATMEHFREASRICLFPPEIPVEAHELASVFGDLGWNEFIQSSDNTQKGEMMRQAQSKGYRPSEVVQYLVEISTQKGLALSDLTDTRGQPISEERVTEGKSAVIRHLTNLYSRNRASWVPAD